MDVFKPIAVLEARGYTDVRIMATKASIPRWYRLSIVVFVNKEIGEYFIAQEFRDDISPDLMQLELENMTTTLIKELEKL